MSDDASVAGRPRLPKVSILVRTTGRVPLLRQALASVAAQRYRRIEVVLVEDGPATLQPLVDEFAALHIVYAPLDRRRGRSAAGNEALRLATGDYCLFLDDDDGLYPDHVLHLVDAVLATGNHVAHCWALEVPSRYSAAGDRVVRQGAPRCAGHRGFSQLALLDDNYLPINSVLFHRSLYEACGGFDPELARLEDWNLWVRYASHNGPFATVPRVTAYYRVPMDERSNRRRDDELAASLALARKKHAELRFVFDAQQLTIEYARLRDEPLAPAALRRLLTRFPALRPVADVARRLVDRALAARRLQAPRV
jgi:glycosyltransferase involved in cell wall biosynthesis